jgi:hypothetical protein
MTIKKKEGEKGRRKRREKILPHSSLSLILRYENKKTQIRIKNIIKK